LAPTPSPTTGVAFEGNALDLTRLVPVLFVGWDGLR
jgi:hypothetical protein